MRKTIFPTMKSQHFMSFLFNEHWCFSHLCEKSLPGVPVPPAWLCKCSGSVWPEPDNKCRYREEVNKSRTLCCFLFDGGVGARKKRAREGWEEEGRDEAELWWEWIVRIEEGKRWKRDGEDGKGYREWSDSGIKVNSDALFMALYVKISFTCAVLTHCS